MIKNKLSLIIKLVNIKVEEVINRKNEKKKKIIFYLTLFLGIIVVLWFILCLIEYNRVHNDKKPLICFGDSREIESESEYSTSCIGIFYKYKEYYYRATDEISAREFTLFFNDFDRKS